jgi:hypothetical protein
MERMWEQVSKCAVTREQGNMADQMRVKDTLPPLLLKYLQDLEADEKAGLAPSIVEKWRQAALDLTEDVMKYVGRLGKGPRSAADGALETLKKAIRKTATLNEAVTLAVHEPEEEELRDLARKLGTTKKELMAMGKELVVSQPADTATEAHKRISEVGEAIKASRELIKAALREMGVASDISEISGPAGLRRPPPERPSGPFLVPAEHAGSLYLATPTLLSRATPAGTGDKLANLMRGLMGAQANDSGWPTFSRKYAEYPWFRKEWWAYRHTYHGHVRDKLVYRSLKEGAWPAASRFW